MTVRTLSIVVGAAAGTLAFAGTMAAVGLWHMTRYDTTPTSAPGATALALGVATSVFLAIVNVAPSASGATPALCGCGARIETDSDLPVECPDCGRLA